MGILPLYSFGGEFRHLGQWRRPWRRGTSAGDADRYSRSRGQRGAVVRGHGGAPGLPPAPDLKTASASSADLIPLALCACQIHSLAEVVGSGSRENFLASWRVTSSAMF